MEKQIHAAADNVIELLRRKKNISNLLSLLERTCVCMCIFTIKLEFYRSRSVH